MFFSNEKNVTLLGAVGIMVLMVATVITHFKVKNPIYKMLPSMSLIILSFVKFSGMVIGGAIN